jgi:ribosomal RNA-processing protein 36
VNEGLYKTSYGFIGEYQEKEVDILKKEISMEKDPARKQDLKKTLNGLINRLSAQKQKEKREEIKRRARQKEQEMIDKGKKPFFLKKCNPI